MCNFLSAVVLRNGDVLTHPMLDSHSDLIRYFELPDTSKYHQHFAKVELTPEDWLNVDTWTFRLDEETVPGWWDDVSASAESTLRARATAMLVTTGRKDLILDGCWILAGDAEWQEMRGGRIVRMGGSAQIHGVGGSAQIHGVGGSAQIHRVWGSAQIHDVWGSAQIHGVGGSAQLSESAKAHVVKP